MLMHTTGSWLRSAASCFPALDAAFNKARLQAFGLQGIHHRIAHRTAAHNLNMDDEIGSIEVGKKADVIIVSENLLEIDPNDISEADVLYTFVDGKKVFQAQ